MSDYRPMPEWLKKLAGNTHGFEGLAYPYSHEKAGKLSPTPLDGTLLFRSLYHAVIWVPGFSYYGNSMTGTQSYGMKLKLVRLAFPGEPNFKYSEQVQLEEYENKGESRPVTHKLFTRLADKCNALDVDWPIAYERAAAEVLAEESAERARAEQDRLNNLARERLLKHGPALVEETRKVLDVVYRYWLDYENRAVPIYEFDQLLKLHKLVTGELTVNGPVDSEPEPLDPRAELTAP